MHTKLNKHNYIQMILGVHQQLLVHPQLDKYQEFEKRHQCAVANLPKLDAAPAWLFHSLLDFSESSPRPSGKIADRYSIKRIPTVVCDCEEAVCHNNRTLIVYAINSGIVFRSRRLKILKRFADLAHQAVFFP